MATPPDDDLTEAETELLAIFDNAEDAIGRAEECMSRHELGHEFYAIEHLLHAIATVTLADWAERHGISGDGVLARRDAEQPK